LINYLKLLSWLQVELLRCQLDVDGRWRWSDLSLFFFVSLLLCGGFLAHQKLKNDGVGETINERKRNSKKLRIGNNCEEGEVRWLVALTL